jgi:hypothetical protein
MMLLELAGFSCQVTLLLASLWVLRTPPSHSSLETF